MPKIQKIYNKNFKIISNRILDDENLTLKAKGLFVQLWARDDNWNFYISELVKHSKCGRDQVMSALDELEKNGYLLRSRNRNALGQLTTKSTWLLSDVPKKSWIEHKKKQKKVKQSVNKSVNKSTQPKSENPTLDNPTLENPTLPSTNLTKYQYNQLPINYLSYSLPKKRTVKKSPALDYEREEKLNQIIFYFNQKRAYWHMPLTPVSQRERNKLANVVGNHSFERIKPLIDTAAINATTYPTGYLISMIKNLPEEMCNARN